LKPIQIKDKMIGTGFPCFVIAEAGVNHNGRFNLAKKLVDIAVTARADAVKFQTFIAEGVVTSGTGIADYARNNIGKNMKQIDMLKKYELSYDDFTILKEYCDKKDIIFLSSPHSFDAIDFLEDLVPAYKFSSGDITNFPALKHAALKGKPMILGTGMATLQEVKDAVQLIRSKNNNQIIALHCTTNYPCPLEEVNLRAMVTMQKKLNCFVGYSDHTLGSLVPIAAVAMGACILEKHFTLDRNLLGPDHKASLEPNELCDMVRGIRDIEKALGSEEKKPQKSEKEIINIARKSIVASVNIPRGTIIKREMLSIKRPGTGLKAKYYEDVIGKTAKKDIKKNELITWKVLQ